MEASGFTGVFSGVASIASHHSVPTTVTDTGKIASRLAVGFGKMTPRMLAGVRKRPLYHLPESRWLALISASLCVRHGNCIGLKKIARQLVQLHLKRERTVLQWETEAGDIGFIRRVESTEILMTCYLAHAQ